MRQTGTGYIRLVDFVLFNERKIRGAVYAIRNDIPKSAVRGGGVGNPTESAAIRNISPLRSVDIDGTPLEWPEEWLKVIDATRIFASGSREKSGVFADYYNGVDYRITCMNLGICSATHSRIRKEIRQYAALCAANLKLIRFI